MVDSKEDILKKVKENNVKFIHLWFTDILGFLKSVAITSGELLRAINEGIGFDGSSIEGFARIDESDMIAVPDISTFQVLPIGMNEGYNIARILCDIMKPDKTPYEGDPRWILKKTLKEATEMEFASYMGAELEYFYFKSSTLPPQLLDRGGYFDLTPMDVASDLRRRTIQTLENMVISAE
ncbi:MAG: glutamine synthetase beta-grasp domain-containing protein, partial [Candidatus Omnitrophica bacterium]|nr:glutamine synthetase beta-grasp domain-containing protein [Candidatus Omnitrophota bacterium]